MGAQFSNSGKLLAVLLWSGIGCYVATPLVHGNDTAINVIVTVFSILAGFLVATITFIGDPMGLPPGSWRIARLVSNNQYDRLARQQMMFYLYLTSLVLIFISLLIKDTFPAVNKVVEYIYVFFSILSLALSFRLPSTLLQIQRERLEGEVARRRSAAGIDDR